MIYAQVNWFVEAGRGEFETQLVFDILFEASCRCNRLYGAGVVLELLTTLMHVHVSSAVRSDRACTFSFEGRGEMSGRRVSSWHIRFSRTVC